MAQWVALLPHSKKAPGPSPGSARIPFCVESAWVQVIYCEIRFLSGTAPV